MFLLIFATSSVSAATSSCFGTTSSGRLDNGVQLPFSGDNFTAYSLLGHILGRTFVHAEVRDIILNAYQSLAQSQPTKVYKYAESGLPNGGVFSPHKSHQNGLSVDFMTPMISPTGQSVHLPTHPLNQLGYAIEIDSKGYYGELRIDFTAMAAHLVALDKQAKLQGYKLWRVIFDPALQPHLFATKYKAYLQKHIQFSTKPSWVRHDEHYHVDFDVPCQ